MMHLQRCADCGTAQYPAREICGVCLSDRLEWEIADAFPGRVLARTTLHHSNEPRFRPQLPLGVGLVQVEAGPIAICFLTERAPGDNVQVRARLDETGHTVLEAT